MKRALHAVLFAFFGSCLGGNCLGCSPMTKVVDVKDPYTSVYQRQTKDGAGGGLDYTRVRSTMPGGASGMGYNNGMGYGSMPMSFSPAIGGVSYVPEISVPEAEYAAELVRGGAVTYEPVAVIPPAGEYATKEQVKNLALMVKDIKKKSETKSEEETSKKEGK